MGRPPRDMLGGATPPARVAAPPRCRARRQPPARAMGGAPV